MSIKDSNTEQLIKDTAKRVFFKEGKLLATTQEIADAAGVNRTLLHYYFRSRDVLFNLVFKEALAKLRGRLHSVMVSVDPFRKKIENFIDAFFEELTDAPYLETFIVVHANKHPDELGELFTKLPGGSERLKNFLKEIQREIELGNIPEMKPIQFFINLFSLMSYPFVAKPVYQNMFDLSDSAYKKILNERKKVIMSMLFR